jgi:hypothetical protein
LFKEIEEDISRNVGKRKNKEFWRKREANFGLMCKGGIAIHDDHEEMGPYLIFVKRDGLGQDIYQRIRWKQQ